MASVVEAFDDTTSKIYNVYIFLFTIPVFFTYYFYRTGNLDACKILGTVAALLLLTLMSLIFYNIRNCLNKSLPGLNPFYFIFVLVKMIISLTPMFAICIFAGLKLAGLTIPLDLPKAQEIYQIIVWCIFGSFMISSFMSFSKTHSIVSGYNVVMIFRYCVDIFIAVLWMLAKLASLNFLIVGSIAYVFKVYWGLDNFYFAAICSYIFVMNTCIIGHYLSQIHYEVIPKQKNETETQTTLY